MGDLSRSRKLWIEQDSVKKKKRKRKEKENEKEN